MPREGTLVLMIIVAVAFPTAFSLYSRKYDLQLDNSQVMAVALTIGSVAFPALFYLLKELKQGYPFKVWGDEARWFGRISNGTTVCIGPITNVASKLLVGKLEISLPNAIKKTIDFRPLQRTVHVPPDPLVCYNVKFFCEGRREQKLLLEFQEKKHLNVGLVRYREGDDENKSPYAVRVW